MTRCLMCDRPATPETKKCACGSIAFYRGRRPDFPPIVLRACWGCDPNHPDRICEGHQVYGAFLLGPIPRPPNLALLDDRDSRRELARPANGRGH